MSCAPVFAQDFYEDVFEEMDKFGEVENLNVCDNIADHMVGSVYVKFVDETAAAKALQVRGTGTPAAFCCADLLFAHMADTGQALQIAQSLSEQLCGVKSRDGSVHLMPNDRSTS